ncbi:flagellar biosynthesis anti-sigma factor FlgM [Vibrio sp.]|uniref:flagellar biosynthesis anti-sigma factor FlgM n=1 Tax=Vibrio sp. TaxID=678 RepID=UPI00311F1197
MKIDKVSGGHVTQSRLDQAPKKALESTKAKPNSQPQLDINVTAIEQAQAEMQLLADVDMAKVEKVRDALAKGELALDTQALSKAVLEFHTGHD